MQIGFIYKIINLTSVTYLCNRVLFLYKGVVEEILPVAQISEVKSEYAQKLLYSILDIKHD